MVCMIFLAYQLSILTVLLLQLHFPTEDVVNNFQHFMTSVKRATGHIQEHGDGRRRTGGEVKRVIPIAKVMLSSKSGPGIRIADA